MGDVADFNADDKESLTIIGEVGNSEEDGLSFESAILINRDEYMSGHETKAISLGENLQNISLFEGEIIAIEGRPDLRQFIAEKIYKPKPVARKDVGCIGDVRAGIKVVGKEGVHLGDSGSGTLHAGQRTQVRSSQYSA